MEIPRVDSVYMYWNRHDNTAAIRSRAVPIYTSGSPGAYPLPFRASVLEPNFHLYLGELQHAGDLRPLLDR